MRLYRQAAEQGNAERSQSNLGFMYATSTLSVHYSVEAEAVADVGSWRLNRGTLTRSTTSWSCTTTNVGVPQDDAEAVRWYRLAADQGQALAQYNLVRSCKPWMTRGSCATDSW